MSKMKNKILNYLVLLLLSSFLFYTINNTVALVVIDSVEVFSDEDFTNLGLPGSGTIDDPYRIENYEISPTDINNEGIYVKNTTKYFVIQNCEITSAFYGILVEEVAPNTGKILNNILYSNKHDGIGIKDLDGLIISGNTMESSVYATGCTVDNCTNVEFSKNIFQDNPKSGLAIYLGSSLNITENMFLRNHYKGITAATLTDSKIYRNHFELNDEYGLELLQSCSDNLVYHNNFIDNFLMGICQARDSSGENTWYNNLLSEGNYWNEYSGTGSYSIEGGAGCCDLYPLENPVALEGVDSTNFSYLLITLFSLPFVYYIRKKREKA